jgi:hypothetical protein
LLLNLFIYYLFFFFFLLVMTPSVHADSQQEKEDKFDGSEFNASTFKDTDFEKQTYKDNSAREKKEAKLDGAPHPGGEFSKKHHGDEGIEASEGTDKKLNKNLIGENLGERLGPVHELPGDWVPSKIDLTDNGGFGVIPDNGSPVPYRLNGHVDIQRGRPWEIHE